MAHLVPFRGIRYNNKRFKDLSALFTPPYDTISKEEQEWFYRKSPYNIIRIILGKEMEGDNPLENRYTRARDYLARWLSQGILLEDPSPSIYIYSQSFSYQGVCYERNGFIALLKLEGFDQGVVYPHERTLSGPKEDRFMLLHHCMAHTEPIFLLYEDPGGWIRDEILSQIEREPTIEFTYECGTRHRLWAIDDPKTISRITTGMEKKAVYIADGHHRYEVALSFRDKSPYVMVYMVDMDDEGLLILPAHRLIKGLSTEERSDIMQRIERYFCKEEVDSLETLLKRLNQMKDQHPFGMYINGRYTLLVLKGEEVLREIKNPLLRRLDVVILHHLILGMGGEEVEVEEKINYTTSPFEAKKMVEDGKYEMAFFLNPTKVQDVKEVAHSGEPMPGKATYFYPKPLSGLVLYKFK